jgi:hypothetical protein
MTDETKVEIKTDDLLHVAAVIIDKTFSDRISRIASSSPVVNKATVIEGITFDQVLEVSGWDNATEKAADILLNAMPDLADTAEDVFKAKRTQQIEWAKKGGKDKSHASFRSTS